MKHGITIVFPGNERGGAATHLAALASAIGHQNPQPKIRWVSIGAGPLEEKIRDVKTLEVQVLPENPRAALFELVKMMRESSAEMLWHANGPRLNVLTAIAARRAKRKWITTIHSDVRQDFLSSRVKSILFTRIHSMALRSCLGGFVGNLSFQQYLPGKPTFLVPNAVNDCPLSAPKVQFQQRLKAKLEIDSSAMLIGMAVRFDPVKDIPTVLRAFALLAHSNTHLVIAGDGPEREHIVQTAHSLGIDSRVHFLGFIDDVIPFYAGLDIHILASRSEGASPFAILEAGSCEAANIGSDIPGIRNLLQPDVTGLCFPVGDIEALASAMDRLVKDDVLRGNLVHNFRAQVLPRFTEQHMMATYMDGYEALQRGARSATGEGGISSG